jgi:3-oxoacyl-[acyl-carrier protein] reductase
MLVVGGTAGMGLATAHLLAAEGAKVAVVGRDRERASVAVKALADDHGAEVVSIPADVSRPGEAERVVDEAVAAFGGLAGVAVFTGVLGHEPTAVDHEPLPIDVVASTEVVMTGVEHARAQEHQRRLRRVHRRPRRVSDHP